MNDKGLPEGPVPPRKRSIRLKTVFDVNRFLAKLINGVYRDEIDPSKGTKLAYLCGVMLRAFELSDLEQRIATLEESARILEGQRNELTK